MIDSIRGQSLLSLDDLSRAAIVEVLDTAESFVEVNRRTIKKVPALKGRVVASLFFEESTRTRLSFETAAKRLSADVLSLAVASSSVKKGESLRDTIATIDALGIDAVVLRHRSSGAALQVSRYVPHVKVINGGDGQHQHPTQGLLDAFTIRQVLSERLATTGLESGAEVFEGLRILIVGDIRHSRVARSDVAAYATLGAEVRLCAPGTLLPEDVATWPVTVVRRLRRGAGVGRRRGSPSPPERARLRRLRRQPRRIHLHPRPHGRTRPALEARGADHAPRSDEPRRRGRFTRRRVAAGGRRATGQQRRADPHGGALPVRRRIGRGAGTVSAIVIRQGLVVGSSTSTVADVLIVEDRIVEVAASIDAPGDAHVIDARDCWVGPGFVDLHTHLREPGREAAETIESGARAGALGGYCALVAMPNTEPALDSVALVAFVLERGARTPLDVAVAGAITKDRRGESLAPMAEMAALGVRLFTDDGLGVQDPSVMRRALTYAKPLGVRLAQHCEDERLAGEGTHERRGPERSTSDWPVARRWPRS